MLKNDWRPPRREVLRAERLLKLIRHKWSKRRLALVCAVKRQPKSGLQALARAAGTRAQVLNSFLGRWRKLGVESVVEFGRPSRLSANEREQLRRLVDKKELNSPEQIVTWAKDSFGIRLGESEIGRYLVAMGFQVFAKTAYRWDPPRVAELKHATGVSRSLIWPVLRVGTEKNSLRTIAKEEGVSASTLSYRCRMYARQGLSAFERQRNILDADVKAKFIERCDKHFAKTNRAPSRALARQFLKALGFEKSVRQMALHVNNWKRLLGLRIKTRQRRRDWLGFAGVGG